MTIADKLADASHAIGVESLLTGSQVGGVWGHNAIDGAVPISFDACLVGSQHNAAPEAPVQARLCKRQPWELNPQDFRSQYICAAPV